MAKKSSREYWINRAKIKLDKLEKEQDKIEKKLKKSYKEAIKEIKKEIALLYAEGGELTDFQQYRVDGTVRSLESLLDEMATNEEQTLKEGLTDVFNETQKIEASSLDISFQTVNDNVIREVLQTNWSGLTFSERIWDNRKKLASKIKETLNKGLIRGDSLQTMAQNLADVMNKDFNRAMVLVHTETCWVQSEASKRQYKEEGVEQYEFMAFLDNRTTEECKHLDGKVFDVKDGQPGVNMPPMHPRCRSAIIPVVEESIKPVEEKPKKVTREIKGKESEKVKLNPIEALKNKGVTIKEDTFKDFDKKLLDENMKQFAYLIDKYSIVSDYIKERSIEFKGINIKSSTIAQVESNIHKDKLILSLNNKFYEDYNRTIKDHMDNIKKGWSSKSSEKYLPVQSITHEFGHIIHDCIIHNYNKENPKKLEKVVTSAMKGSLSAGKKKLKDYQFKIVREYNKEMIAIAKELEQGFSIEKSLSKYGKTDSFEFFAECFAEYECGANTTISKAMEEMLRRRGVIK